MLYVGDAGKKGRGVFTDVKYKKGELIECAHTIVCPYSDLDLKGYVENKIHSYIYEYENSKFLIGCGFASLYNHSDKPNAGFYVQDSREGPLIFIEALEKIRPGDEITIKYSDEPMDFGDT